MSSPPQTTVGVLIPVRGDAPSKRPAQFPIGRAALSLRVQGIRVVFGETTDDGSLSGMEATASGWESVTAVPLDAVYDRFPSQKEPDAYDRAVEGLSGVTLGNPMSMTLLCRDKLASQRLLEDCVRMPPLADLPSDFTGAMTDFEVGFMKPRYGAFGRGVRRVVVGDPLPAMGVGTLKGVIEPMLLQRGVQPPSGSAGISVRLLSSRLPGGGWRLFPGVARVSKADPVINVYRGAAALPAVDVLSSTTVAMMREMVARGCERLSRLPDGERLVELGWDMMIDAQGVPWVIEVNSRPRGRLASLASQDTARFGADHLCATAAPMVYLSWLATSTSRR